MAEAANVQSPQNPAEPALSREWGVALTMLVALLVVALLAFLDSGARGFGLLGLGALLGGVFCISNMALPPAGAIFLSAAR